MCLASAVTIGLGIADVTITFFNCNPCPLSTPIALTWVGVGIWASIPVFINGIGAIWISGHLEAHKGWFCLLSFMSTIMFTTALVVISSFEVAQKFPSGLPSSPPTMNQVQFGIEIAIAVLGFVLHLHALLLFYYVCCCKQGCKKHEPEAATSKPSLPEPVQQQASQQVPQQPQQPPNDQQSDIDRMNIWSAYRFNNGPSGPAGPPMPKPAGNYYISGALPARTQMGPGSYYGVGMGGGNYQMPRQVLAGGQSAMAPRW